MKIVLLSDGIPPEGKGGAERIAWESARSLHARGHEVIVITTRRDGRETEESEVGGIRIFSIPTKYHVCWRAWRSLYNPGPVREVKRLLAELRPDVVHAHNVHQYLSYATFRVARTCGARVFHTFHDATAIHEGKLLDNYRVSEWNQMKESRLRYNPFRTMYIRRALKNAKLIAVSTALRDVLERNGIQNIHVVYNGIDAQEWRVSKSFESKISEQTKDKKVILFGGRVSGAKGGDALLIALPLVVKVVPEAVLMIMGIENEYVNGLKAKANQAGIADHILCTGWIAGDDLKAAYHTAAVVTVPSVYIDPLPTVVLEAMACSKAVVGSCLGGIPEMVQDGVTGYVVNPLDAGTLADRLIELLQNPERAREFGAAGARLQQEKFDAATQTDKLIHYYHV